MDDGDPRDSIGQQSAEKRARIRSKPSRRAQGLEDPDRDHVFVYDNPMHTDTAKGVLTTRLATHQPELIPHGNMDVTLRARSPESALSALKEQTRYAGNMSKHACLSEYDVQDDPTLILALLAEQIVVKFDSGASRCMSGDPDRIGAYHGPLLDRYVSLVSMDLEVRLLPWA